MRRNWLLACVLSMTVYASRPTSLFCQGSSTKETQDDETVYSVVGHGITPPRATFDPEPEYDEESRGAKIEGTVLLSMVVTKEGRTRDIKITRSLSSGLDKKAIEAVSTWRFDPATKEGKPVAVRIVVEVEFHL